MPEAQVQRAVSTALRYREALQLGTIQAMLLATGLSSPTLVPVPVHRGYEKHPRPCDLHVNFYTHHHDFDAEPILDYPYLQAAFTIARHNDQYGIHVIESRENRQGDPPPYRINQLLCTVTHNEHLSVAGEVLLVKTDGHGVCIDITHEDIERIVMGLRSFYSTPG